ncbi:MAG: hypothetical protein U5K56_08605 [Halioglobus sp.]|nr:hypothetical protein [Halioglobus sp.]
MKLLVIIVMLLVAGCLFVMLRRKPETSPSVRSLNAAPRPAKKSAHKARKVEHPFSAKSIAPGEDACGAVLAIGKKRFLDADGDIPVVPLTDCDAPRCRCTYLSHEDRREYNEDRRHPNSLHSELYNKDGNSERRQRKRGRRKTDWA